MIQKEFKRSLAGLLGVFFLITSVSTASFDLFNRYRENNSQVSIFNQGHFYHATSQSPADQKEEENKSSEWEDDKIQNRIVTEDQDAYFNISFSDGLLMEDYNAPTFFGNAPRITLYITKCSLLI